MIKYRRLKYLGKGSYGAAILVELKSNPSTKYVMKEIIIGHLKDKDRLTATKEAEVLNQMKHSNITTYIESFVENSKLYIVMEYADGGDLGVSIKKRKQSGQKWSELEVMTILVQILVALKHVHDHNILHRDLKAQNIFLTAAGVVKLGDFGIARVLDSSEDQAKTQIGTPYYLSPEICESKPYGRTSDVWSLGIILYELMALELPFQASSLPALVHHICTVEPNYTIIEGQYSREMLSLCQSMLQKSPDNRPTVQELYETKFVKRYLSDHLSYTIIDNNVSNNHQPVTVFNRSKELEKLRKFRQDMMRKRGNQMKSDINVLANLANNINNINNNKNNYNNNGNNKGLVNLDATMDLRSPFYRANNEINNDNHYHNNQYKYDNRKQDMYNNKGYETIARREFFANRAAAIAIKAKVEFEERGGLMIIKDNPSKKTNNNNDSDYYNDKVALLKAKKLEKKDKEVADRERQIQLAMQLNREERRRLAERKKEVDYAFEVSK